MRISKRTREEAIEACTLIGDNRLARVAAEESLTEGPEFLAADDAADKAVRVVMWQARQAVCKIVYTGHGAWPLNGYVWLEAAAPLRDGWNPGDPVEAR